MRHRAEPAKETAVASLLLDHEPLGGVLTESSIANLRHLRRTSCLVSRGVLAAMSDAQKRTPPRRSRRTLEVSLDRRSDPTRNLVGSHRRNGREPQHIANEHESEELAGDEGRASLGVVNVERSYELPHDDMHEGVPHHLCRALVAHRRSKQAHKVPAFARVPQLDPADREALAQTGDPGCCHRGDEEGRIDRQGHRRDEESVFGPEKVCDEPLIDVRGPTDRSQGRALIAPLGELIAGRREDLRAGHTRSRPPSYGHRSLLSVRSIVDAGYSAIAE